MGDPARKDDVLGQKASAARRAFEARAMSPAKALRRALSRTADIAWDLALVTHGVSQDMADQDGVVEMLPPDTLLLLLDGPDGALGLAMIDRELMTGLIEVQTLLQVTQMPVAERPLTQTDAAMMAPLLDGTLERFERYLEGHPLQPQFSGFRFGAMVEDARNAGLLLDATGYRSFTVSVDLALGRRKGTLMIILPDRPDAAKPGGAGDADAPGPHARQMKLLPVQMDAVLCSVTLPLSAAQKLRPGDLIPLPPEALEQVAFLAASRAGDAIAGGRLGQMNGMRAVRLAWPEGVAAPDEPAAQGAAPGWQAEPSEPAPDAAMPEPPAPAPVEEIAPDDLAGDLPDLPPMEFDTGDFSFDADPAEEEAEAGAMDFDFAAAPLDIEES